jgi:hypothetical protein
VLQAFTGRAVLMALAGLLAPGPPLITDRANPLGVGPAWLTSTSWPSPVVVTGFWALPAAIVTAVLRYRLYDIDRLVSRTVTYGVVAGLLAAVYVAGVFLLSGVLPLEGDLAVAASTLAVGASRRGCDAGPAWRTMACPERARRPAR